MSEREATGPESNVIHGGHVPGHPECPAFSLTLIDPSPIPVLIAVPHAGRAYASTLLERMRHPSFAAPRLEDRYVDLLATAVAKRTGASLLVANAPRAMIDLNRSPDDIDWEMLGVAAPDASAQSRFGLRARSGLGLVPRRLPGLGELWKRRMDHAELEDRIAGVHAPYHEALGETLEGLRRRWGAALLVDLHSMPPLSPRGGMGVAPDFVIGDRFGASCDGALVASAFAHFAETRRPAAHNRPYAGGYVLERHAARRQGVHCIQIEIDRQRYLDSRLAEPGPGFDTMVEVLTGLVRRLAGDVAALGREVSARDQAVWREAAE
jgi:N-formylglutamate amidohydrolase